MSGVQIKAWDCGNKPVDDRGHYVQIAGRTNGWQGRMLNLAGLDTTVRLAVNLERMEYSNWGWKGQRTHIVPLENISQAWWGIEKPWCEALCIVTLGFLVGFGPDWVGLLNLHSLSDWSFVPGLLVAATACLAAAVKYSMGRQVILGFQTITGQQMCIRFQRTVLRGMSVGEEEARRMCKVVQRLIEAKHRLRKGF